MFGSLGALAGSALGQVGDALSMPRRALWGALGLPGSGEELLANTFGMDRESPWTKALGIGTEMLLDPLTYVGLGAGKAAGALSGAGKAASGVEAMLPARRAFTAIKDIPTEGGSVLANVLADNANTGIRAVGKSVEPEKVLSALTKYDNVAGEVGLNSKSLQGAFSPSDRMALLPSGASPNTSRHELIHGMINAMRLGEAPTRGAPIPMRAAAWLGSRESPFLRGLGKMADETAAYSLSEKGLMNQLKGGAHYLFSRDPYYKQTIGSISPSAAALYDNLPLMTALGLGGGAAAGGLSYFSQ